MTGVSDLGLPSTVAGFPAGSRKQRRAPLCPTPQRNEGLPTAVAWCPGRNGGARFSSNYSSVAQSTDDRLQ